MKLNMDFSGVKDFNVPDGLYEVQLQKIEKVTGSEFPKLQWTFVVIGGPHRGTELRYGTSLNPKAAVFVRRALVALGQTVPQSVYTLDTEALVGKRCMAKVVNTNKVMDDGSERTYSNIKEVLSLAAGKGATTDPTLPDAAKPKSDDDYLELEDGN